MNTHKMLAKNFIDNIDKQKRFLIKESHFIWGNIKPDCVSKYKLKKHYLNESLDMIVKKIEFLASLNIYDIHTKYSLNSFNQELGVICHFLCDYFCVPHNQRWEFKNPNAMKEHIIYEKNLAKVAKNFVIKKDIDTTLTSKEIIQYIMNLQDKYEAEVNYENDLEFAYYACDSIINMVLDQVIINEKIRENIYVTL